MAILTPDKTNTWNGLKVYEYFLTNHNPNKIDMPGHKLPTTPLGVTVHNTGAISVSSSTTMAEQYTRATVNGNMGDVRVHFYVDDVCAWQNLPFTLGGWHAADGDGDGNAKTISIEVIGNSAKAEANAVKLVAYLLNKYKLTVEKNLFTHSHWLNYEDGLRGDIDYLNTHHRNGKNCPIYILPHWDTFKKNVNDSLKKLSGGATTSTTTPSTTTKTTLYRVRKTWADEKSQIGAYSTLENAKKACKDGYKVFDEKGNVVYPTSTTTSKPTTSTAITKIDVTYNAYTTSWLGEVKNWNNTNENGYAGVENRGIKAIALKAAKGKLKYRVHVKNGGWLSWISDYNINNWVSGCAGIKTKEIDGIQISLTDLSGYTVKYRVSLLNDNKYLDWVTEYGSGDDGYAGIFGKSIDKLQIEIVKK